MKKVLSLVAAVIFGVSTLYAAGDDKIAAGGRNCPKTPPKKKEVKPCPPMPNKDVTPSARGCYCSENMPFFMVDFLWWQASENDRGYAFKSTDTILTNFGRTVRNTHEWAPGFRFGMGWNSDYDGWDVLLNWTWYYNKSKDSIHFPASGTSGLNATWATDPTFLVSDASNTYRLHYNMIDFEMGRNFYVSSALALRPFMGLRGGWIYRRYDVEYTNALAAAETFTTPINYRGKVDQWGIGPRIGLNTEWCLKYGLEVFGDFSTTLLSGKSVDRTRVVSVNPTSGALQESSNHFDSYWVTAVDFQMALGLGWSKCLRSECFKHDWFVSLKLGWEMNKWLNLGTFLPSLGLSSPAAANLEDMTLQGLTFSGRFDF